MKKIIYLFAVSFTFCLISCSSDDDNPDNNTKQAIVTFSVSEQFSKAEGDDFTLSVSAWQADATYIDWKVDGNIEKGIVVTISDDYVDGGQSNVVVESVRDFSEGMVNISGFNVDGDPYTVNYKIEFYGKIVDEQTIVQNAGDDAFYKTYQLK